MTLGWRNFWWLFRRSFVLAYQDNCFGTAKGAAYSALLSFFPLLTATAAILVQAQAQPVSRIIVRALSHVVPPGTEELVLDRFRVGGQRPITLLVVASLISVWAAAGVFKSLMEGFQAAYHVPVGRSFLRHQGVAVLLVVTAAAPALGASAIVLLGSRVEQHVLGWLGLIPEGVQIEGWIVVAGVALRYALAFVTVVLVTAMLYYIGPYRPQRWSCVMPGALVATGLWMAATIGFTWYVRNIADYNVLYGSIGAVIALLIWMYVLSLIGLIGCEFNAEYERMRAARA